MLFVYEFNIVELLFMYYFNKLDLIFFYLDFVGIREFLVFENEVYVIVLSILFIDFFVDFFVLILFDWLF